LRPFAGEERHDRGAAFENLGTVTPTATFRIGERHPFGIARIPGVFGHAGLLGGGLSGERRKRGTRHGDLGFLMRRECVAAIRRRLLTIARSDRPSAIPAALLV